MTALPSILAGLFIFATWILILGLRALRPRGVDRDQHHDAADHHPLRRRRAATGAGQPARGRRRRSVRRSGARCGTSCCPTARSGLTTSVILGVARGIGETAPVLLTAGFTATLNLNPLENPMVSLPLAAFELVKLAAAEPDRPWLRRRRGADGARADAVHARPHPRWPPRRSTVEASGRSDARRPLGGATSKRIECPTQPRLATEAASRRSPPRSIAMTAVRRSVVRSAARRGSSVATFARRWPRPRPVGRRRSYQRISGEGLVVGGERASTRCA